MARVPPLAPLVELVDCPDHVHHAAFPDFADEFGGAVGEEVGGGGFQTGFGDDDGTGLFGRFVEFHDDFFHPRRFARGVEVVSACFGAGLDYGGGI